MSVPRKDLRSVPAFGRVFFESGEPFMRIGDGDFGGKATGLVEARAVLDEHLRPDDEPTVRVEIPTTTVLATDVFDAFMERNGLYDVALSGATDDRIALAFQGGDLPVEYLGDLRALVDETSGHPLAVRSSSLLEDALAHPFAGVYETKMIPNNQADSNVRFKHLVEAVKFVYASTFFRAAKSYIEAIDKTPRDEKMAVVIQEVVGRRFGERFYPHLSGVCRSYNYYRTGRARPDEGVVNLALGLGKTIVDGGLVWAYSPAHPKVRPPAASVGELLKNSQLRFWAVNTGKPPAFDPTRETEYLLESSLDDAEYDDSLRFVASTYDTARDRLSPGVGVKGPRLLDFAPLLELEQWPLNRVIRRLLEAFEQTSRGAVEIEFAMTLPQRAEGAARLAFLQVRPMLVSTESVDLAEGIDETSGVLLSSHRVMGNGVVDTMRDVVYVKPESFEARLTPKIAADLESFNKNLLRAGRPYLLIGFGRWGSSDPWLGIPVNWGQINGAKVIVESKLEGMNVEPSQGAHFFHNISSFRVSYFSVDLDGKPGIDWAWLARQRVVRETDLVRHVELDDPLLVKVDGRVGRGVVRHSGGKRT